MAIETTKWDAADHIETAEDVVAYLEAAFEDGDPELITSALGDIARSRGMGAVATEAGISRAGLYKALGEGGDPKLSTLLGVMKALGLHLSVGPAKAA